MEKCSINDIRQDGVGTGDFAGSRMMDKFSINGIQQVGVGTGDFAGSKRWFARNFGFDVKVLEDDTVAERMLPYTGGRAQKRHAGIDINLNGGGGLEIWQYSERKPVPPAKPAAIGDLGIFAAKIKCFDIDAAHAKLIAGAGGEATDKAVHATAHAELRTGKVGSGGGPVFATPIARTPDGTPCFWVKDLYGNIFQIVESEERFIRQKSPFGGVCGAMVGVSDMERAVDFWCGILGYDTVKYDVRGTFPEWSAGTSRQKEAAGAAQPGSEESAAAAQPGGEASAAAAQPGAANAAALPGGGESYRRVLLTCSGRASSAFSGLYGGDCVELVQALDRKPDKIYEGRYWGDPGFIQICYDVTGMDALGRFCASKGSPFTVDSCPDGEIFDMGEASGRFTYIEDPDGTLIEFVETFKVPIAAKLGWYIDLRKRDPSRPLPKFLFRAMGLTSRIK